MNRAIDWMARNGVAANLLMLFIAAAGAFGLLSVKQEVFPEFSLDTIEVRVEYPGASPEEVEQAVVQRVEDRVEGVDGVRRVTAVASEGVGVVLAELQLGTEEARALDEIKAEVDRITSFPVDAEEPSVTALTARSRVIEIALFGDVNERALKELANRVEDDLSAFPEISFVQVGGVRAYEISIEVSRDRLREYGLTLEEIAATVQRGSLDLPGGSVETDREEILVRVEGQNYTRADFAGIVVRGEPEGARLRLDEVAEIHDGFEDADLESRFDGKPAAFVRVFRTGDERVLDIVDRVEGYLDTELRPNLPAGIDAAIWENEAEYLDSRIRLLLKNAQIGLVLVLVALALFLNLRLAFWTAVGIFLSFAGTFAVMALLDVSINMLSLFGFILAIGIVVDDAIVVGENIYAEREKGTSGVEASIRGTRRISVPVTFAILTTVAAFTPLLFVPGSIGKFLSEIPTIVIAVLMLSLVEALFILPYHLSHLPLATRAPREGLRGALARTRAKLQAGLQRFIDGPLDRSVSLATRRPGLIVAVMLALVLVVTGLVAGRYIRFSFLPLIEGEEVIAYLELPDGTSSARTREVATYIEDVGYRVADRLQQTLADDHPSLVRSVYTSVGNRPSVEVSPGLTANPTFIQSNIAEINFRLGRAEGRELSAVEFERAWRDAVGTVPEARTLTFSSQLIDLGSPIQVEMSHPDPGSLNRAVAALEARLAEFGGVLDVRDDRGQGKREVQLRLRPEATTLGITLEALARQVRAAFFGVEALRLQRGRDEVRVYVRLPAEERNTVSDLQDYRIRTPTGGEVPLGQVALVSNTEGATSIRRIDGRRIVTVTADVNNAIVTGGEVNAALEDEVLPALEERYPGLRVGFGGEQREQAQALGGMVRGFALALLVIYALLAIPFRSYLQPLVIMAAIPFGFVGAAFGHLLMGIDMGMLSLFGIVGLSGVVVNDSLVLLDFVNESHRSGVPLPEAIRGAVRVRFRPILLTSLTTFLGISPLMVERSIQARFLVPMAVSLGFGILFATGIIMVLVPALAVLQDRAARWTRSIFTRRRRTPVDLGWAGEV